eukprot:scaffold16036_cov58-Phaeocystis_antarctica.AAC.4
MVELSVAKGLFRGYTPAPASPPRSSTSCEARLVLRAKLRDTPLQRTQVGPTTLRASAVGLSRPTEGGGDGHRTSTDWLKQLEVGARRGLVRQGRSPAAALILPQSAARTSWASASASSMRRSSARPFVLVLPTLAGPPGPSSLAPRPSSDDSLDALFPKTRGGAAGQRLGLHGAEGADPKAGWHQQRRALVDAITPILFCVSPSSPIARGACISMLR